MRLSRLVLTALALGLFATAPAAAQSVPQDVTLTMSDGAQIACTFWQPIGAGPARDPAVMLFHGLGGTRQDMAAYADRLGADGYAALACDARGHGASGGVFGLDGPRDVQDTKELYAWLAAQPVVDPNEIGAVGLSLGGGAVWEAAAAGVPFKAIVPMITWTDLAEALAPQRLAKSGLVLYLSRLAPQARFDPALLAVFPGLVSGSGYAAAAALADARSVVSELPRLTVPTLLIQGRHDFLFDIDQALAAYRRLAGPKRLYLGDLGHAPAPNPAAEQPYLIAEVEAWLDRYLKGIPNGIDRRPPVALAADPWTGAVAQYATTPPTQRLTLSLRGRTTVHQGGKVVRRIVLPRARETFGDSVVSFPASGSAGWDHVVAVLSFGSTVVSEGGVPTPRLTTKPRTVRIRLFDEAVRIPRGARLTLTLAATSTAQSRANLVYAREVPAGSKLTVGKVTLSLSVLKKPVSGRR
jgi:alpha-beta hydrolase superfamily lysophospholipase